MKRPLFAAARVVGRRSREFSRVLANARKRRSLSAVVVPSPHTRSRVSVVVVVAVRLLLLLLPLLSPASRFYKASDGIQLEVGDDLARARVHASVGATASVRVLLLLLLLLVLVCSLAAGLGARPTIPGRDRCAAEMLSRGSR